MKEPEPTPLLYLKAKASEIRERFDREISEVFPTYSMSYDVYTAEGGQHGRMESLRL